MWLWVLSVVFLLIDKFFSGFCGFFCVFCCKLRGVWWSIRGKFLRWRVSMCSVV